jgi:hypothetical protein
LVPSSVHVTSEPANGSTAVNGTTGAIAYTPDPDWNGTDSFDYEVCDDASPAECDTATVSINVTAVNDPPVAVDDSAYTLQGTVVTVSVLDNDHDPDGDDISVVSVGPADNGNTGTNGVTVTYTATLEFLGTDVFTYTVSDGSLAATGTVTVTVAANLPPTISVIPDQETVKNVPVGPISFTVGDLETPVGQLMVSGRSSNAALVPDGNILFGGTGANRTVLIVPAAASSGETMITITVDDGTHTADRIFRVTVWASRIFMPMVARGP